MLPRGRDPRFDGKLHSTAGSLRDIDYDALVVDFGLQDQVATLDKLALAAFEGQYDGGGRYDMSDPDSPRFGFRSKIDGMNLKSLLASQMPGRKSGWRGRCSPI